MAIAAAPLFASTTIRSIDINAVLSDNGSMRVTEVWDIKCSDITEWYLVRSNLGDIEIKDLEVSDDTGRTFVNEGAWNVNRSLSQKAYKCGIVDKGRDGYELCWGVGSDGSHVFTASYTMTNVVKSLNDYDMLHIQFISDELSSAPKSARLTISYPGTEFNSDNSRVWGFGYDGSIGFQDDGTVIAESDGAFGYSSSMIVLMRFEKGMFHSQSVQDRDFQSELDRSLEGASWDDEEEESLGVILLSFLMTMAFMYFFFIYPFVALFRKSTGKVSKRQVRKFLGAKKKDISWIRDIPFDGDLLEADYVLTKIGEDRKQNSLAAALILQMLKDGQLTTRKDADEKVEILFNDNADFSKMSTVAKDLYQMMKEASGADVVLQDKEFSKWSKTHKTQLTTWTSSITKEALKRLNKDNYIRGSKLTEAGKVKAQGVVGFKKYLQDFTIINERQSVEVHLWQDYLSFAALYGIADKVAKELKDINPVAFDELVTLDYDTYRNVVFMTRNLANAITNATITPKTYSSGGGFSGGMGGFGGHSSFGGGGGFSGGGHGGGGR